MILKIEDQNKSMSMRNGTILIALVLSLITCQSELKAQDLVAKLQMLTDTNTAYKNLIKLKKDSLSSLNTLEKRIQALKKDQEVVSRKITPLITAISAEKNKPLIDLSKQQATIKNASDSLDYFKKELSALQSRSIAIKDSLTKYQSFNVDSIKQSITKNSKYYKDSVFSSIRILSDKITISNIFKNNQKQIEESSATLEKEIIEKYNKRADTLFFEAVPNQAAIQDLVLFKNTVVQKKLIDASKFRNENTVLSYISLRNEILAIIATKPNKTALFSAISKIDEFTKSNSKGIADVQKTEFSRLKNLCENYCALTNRIYSIFQEKSVLNKFEFGDNGTIYQENLTLLNEIKTSFGIQAYKYLVDEIDRLINLAKAKKSLSHRLESCQ